MYNLLAWDRDGKVNSGFGYRPASATNGKGSTNHKGIDLSSDNDNVPSVLSGTVIENAWNNARGWFITILQSDGTKARYQHLASQSGLAVGSSVQEGQTIGTQGNTGASTGKHLHFEVMDANGSYIDPVKYLSGATNTTILTDAHGRPVSNAAGTGGADNVQIGAGSESWDWLWDILGDIITFLVVLVVLAAAVVLFLKAFEIKLF